MCNNYRTDKQWKSICESALNGNWKDAGDMVKKFEDEDYHILEPTDLAFLAELAQEVRQMEESK